MTRMNEQDLDALAQAGHLITSRGEVTDLRNGVPEEARVNGVRVYRMDNGTLRADCERGARVLRSGEGGAVVRPVVREIGGVSVQGICTRDFLKVGEQLEEARGLVKHPEKITAMALGERGEAWVRVGSGWQALRTLRREAQGAQGAQETRACSPVPGTPRPLPQERRSQTRLLLLAAALASEVGRGLHE